MKPVEMICFEGLTITQPTPRLGSLLQPAMQSATSRKR